MREAPGLVRLKNPICEFDDAGAGMAAKIYLQVIDDTDPDQDGVIVAHVLPVIAGNEDENLACGSCKAVLGRNISTRTVYERFPGNHRRIIRCTCGADNLLPGPTG
jgi:hypothetical protein